jgi:hypothetical protein
MESIILLAKKKRLLHCLQIFTHFQMIRGLSLSPSVLGSIERIRSAVQHEEYEIRFFATKYIKKIS